MGTGRWIVVAVVLVVMAGAVFSQIEPERATPGQWMYGVFWGEGVWSWYAPGRVVDNVSAQKFAKAMGVPYSSDDVVLQMRVLNRLGAEGWELVAVTRENKHILKHVK